MTEPELLTIELDEGERFLLRCGLNEWGGPSQCTEEMAHAMGFDSVAALFRESDRLIPAIESGQPLSALDWCRAVLATEIVFASNLMGSGHDWMFTTGLSDEESLNLLRKVQRKMPRDVYATIGNGLGTRPARPVN